MDLKDYREKIDGIDRNIVELFVERMKTSAEIAEYKKENGLPVFDEQREKELLAGIGESGGEYCEKLYEKILELSKEYQEALIKGENDS